MELRKKRRKPLSEEEKLQIGMSYRQGKSSLQLAREFCVAKKSVLTVLGAAGVKMRPNSIANRKYTLDQKVFAELNPASAYWLGFLLADGSVCHNTVKLALSSVDTNHLRKFASFVKTDKPVRHYRGSGYSPSHVSAELSLNSSVMAKDLARWGVTPRKTFTARVHSDLVDNVDFWRGAIDGDGCLGGATRPYISLTGTKHVIESFLRFICAHVCGTKARAYDHRESIGIYTMNITCGPAAKTIKHLYSNATVYLDRKKEKADETLIRWGRYLATP